MEDAAREDALEAGELHQNSLCAAPIYLERRLGKSQTHVSRAESHNSLGMSLQVLQSKLITVMNGTLVVQRVTPDMFCSAWPTILCLKIFLPLFFPPTR